MLLPRNQKALKIKVLKHVIIRTLVSKIEVYSTSNVKFDPQTVTCALAFHSYWFLSLLFVAFDFALFNQFASRKCLSEAKSCSMSTNNSFNSDAFLLNYF